MPTVFRLTALVASFAALTAASSPASAEPNCSNAYDKTSYYDFKTACFKHDVCYSEANLVGMDKKRCDERFFQHMKASCRGNLFCLGAAAVYYQGVRNLPQSSFDNAVAKGLSIDKKIERSGDQAGRDLFAKRASAQKIWTAKYVECAKLSGAARDACKFELNRILVPDIPGKYHLGDCNTLGINWKEGHRTANALTQSKRLGLPLSVIQDRESPGDPCQGHYLD